MLATQRFQFSVEEWSAAKERLRQVLVHTASREQLITYTNVAGTLSDVRLSPESKALSSLLYEVTREGYLSGAGLLSAVVVKAGPVPFPGDGFFKCADECGKRVLGRQRFWIYELNRLYSLHKEKPEAFQIVSPR